MMGGMEGAEMLEGLGATPEGLGAEPEAVDSAEPADQLVELAE